MAHVILWLMQVIIIKWIIIKLLRTLCFCNSSLEIIQWIASPLCRKSINKPGSQNHNHDPIAVLHLRPTSYWPVTDPRPGCDRLELPVWLGKSLHEIKISRVTCGRFTTVPNNTRPSSKLRPTCIDLRRKEDLGELGHLQVKLTSSTTFCWVT